MRPRSRCEGTPPSLPDYRGAQGTESPSVVSLGSLGLGRVRGARFSFGRQQFRGTLNHRGRLQAGLRIRRLAPRLFVAADAVTESLADRSEAIASNQEQEENRDDDEGRQTCRREAS